MLHIDLVREVPPRRLKPRQIEIARGTPKVIEAETA